MAYVLAWRYRNWVVDALNKNTPFDRFIRQQIAGDLLPAGSPAERDENLLGTGFLTVGVKTLGEQNLEQYELNVADDQIDATGRAFPRAHGELRALPRSQVRSDPGARLLRARGHLPQHRAPHRRGDEQPQGGGGRAWRSVPNGRERAVAVKAHAEKLAGMTKEYVEVAQKRNTMRDELVKAGIQPAKALAEIDKMPAEMAVKLTTLSALDKSVEDWKARLKTMQERPPTPPPFGMAVQEKAKAADSPRYYKGDVKTAAGDGPARAAQRAGAVPFAAIPAGESGRRQLAEWIARADNPLTGRVIVNRIWQHLFGRGLVETPDDFGTMGTAPTHPALLDDLAYRFVRGGWNVKALIRELVLSRTYRQASRAAMGAAGLEKDADNKLLWRMNRKPLEAEALRDALLEIRGHA